MSNIQLAMGENIFWQIQTYIWNILTLRFVEGQSRGQLNRKLFSKETETMHLFRLGRDPRNKDTIASKEPSDNLGINGI